jgi:putative transposase
MNDLYGFCGISRQGHFKRLTSERKWAEKEYLIVGLILQIREIHPAMGLRTMYEFYQPEAIGRDAFINIGLTYGFRTKTFRNQARTTFSSPYSRYKNLLIDKSINNVNQLWTSDLTYFKVGDTFFYIVFIMDVYSRKIVGYSAADNMRAENNCEALSMAFKHRNCFKYTELIHHSDRGGQYISDLYTGLLNDAEIKISMCNEVYENAHVERINATIKNQYLIHWNITSFEQLKKQLNRAVKTYNEQRPHSALQGITPEAFERQIINMDDHKRPEIKIWTSNYSKNENPNQCLLQF